MSAIESFFDLEPAIVDRLRAMLLPGMQVLSGEDLENVQEESQPAPAAHVIYDGFSVMQTQASGKAAMLRHRYLVVIVVRHAGAAAKAAAESKQRAAPYVVSICEALMGFRPETRPATPGLTLATPPRPTRRKPFFYFPLLFTADVPITSRSS